jgi:1-acyl-sn-glycerol-3-phosphate acyltransferase
MKHFSGMLLRLGGWKIHVNEAFKLDKAVVIMAPHTSMLDFWIGRLAFWWLKLPAHFMIKKELFWFPLNLILRKLGAIPVNRRNSGKITEELADMFRKRKQFLLVITPEGTRNLTHHWKKGFYRIALEADVPVLLGYIDYKKRTGGIGKMMIPTGNYVEDMKEIQDFYAGITARYPEKFNLSQMYSDQTNKL